MSNTVFQVRRSTISGTRPATSSIQTGELAINLPDGILFSTDGSTVFEIGANNTTHNVTGNSYAVNVYSTGTINAVAHTVGSGVAANSSGFFSNAGFFSTLNGQKITFTSLAGGSNVYFTQQNDDNFVFYTTNTTNGTRPVWSIFANSITSSLTISTPAVFNANITIGALIANGSIGTLNQVLTSNGTGAFWSSPGAASVNTAAQYIWSNTQTFSANISFTGNNISVVNGTGSIQFDGAADTNWRIGRNTSSPTKYVYTNNTLDFLSGGSNLEGFTFGAPSVNTYLEIGSSGTFTKNPVYVGNAAVNVSINSTAISSNSITLGSANGITLYSYNGQVNASSGNFIANAYATLSGAGGNYLAFGQQTNFAQWIQSGFSSASTPNYCSIVLNPLGGNVGIGNTAPDATLKVTGTANVSGNVVIGGSLNAANVTASLFTGNVTGTASNATNLNSQPGSYYTNATNITTGTLPFAQLPANVVNTSAAFTITGMHTFSNGITFSNTITANGSNGTAGYVLTSSGATGNVYWAAASAGVNTAAQYSWSNTQTFSSNVTFSSFILGNNIQASNGFISLGSYNNTFSHGIVMDYVTGMGRISVGPADGITFYNGNVATTATMTISNTGNVGIGNTVPATMLQIGGNYGVIAQTIASTNAISVNCASGNYFIATANGSATTITFTSVPANTVYAMVIRLANGGVNTFTWSSSPKWPSGSAPTVSSNTDIFTFVTENGGTTWYGVQSMIDVR